MACSFRRAQMQQQSIRQLFRVIPQTKYLNKNPLIIENVAHLRVDEVSSGDI